MDGVYVVTRDNIAHNAANVLARLGLSGVEIQLTRIAYEKIGIFIIGMKRRKRRRALGLCPVRINPRMKLHASLVALVYHELQRIPHRSGCLALYTGQEAAPRFV